MVQERSILRSLTVGLDVVSNVDDQRAFGSKIYMLSAFAHSINLRLVAQSICDPSRALHTCIRIIELCGHSLIIVVRHDGGSVRALSNLGGLSKAILDPAVLVCDSPHWLREFARRRNVEMVVEDSRRLNIELEKKSVGYVA